VLREHEPFTGAGKSTWVKSRPLVQPLDRAHSPTSYTAVGRQEATTQYQRAGDIFAQLKNENQIGLDDLKNLARARAGLQSLTG